MKCEKISIKKLENNNIPGNYLFADEKNYYFNKYVRNSLFIKDKDAVVDTEKVDCYYDYLTQVVNFLKVHKINHQYYILAITLIVLS